MIHGNLRNKLSRNSAQRSALIKNMVKSFFENNGTMSTTLKRAKVVRISIEKIITVAKKALSNEQNKLTGLRILYSYLNSKKLVDKVMEIGESFMNRNGGYTRVLKSGFRHGDNACKSYILLV